MKRIFQYRGGRQSNASGRFLFGCACLAALCAPLNWARPQAGSAKASGPMILRLTKSVERLLPNEMSPGIGVVSETPTSAEELALLYARTSKSGKLALAAPASVIAVGPYLDSVDQVEVQAVVRHADLVEIELCYTRQRLLGAQLRRNVIWRPLVVIPLRLTAGDYRLSVKWRAVTSLPAARSEDLPGIEPLHYERQVTIF